VALVAALASDVELLLLDEPTSGLDPLMEEMFRQCIDEERQEGRTVLLSSHILAEAEALCDRVSIIRRGRTVETGSLSDLRHLARTSVVAELSGPPPTGFERQPGVRSLQVRQTPDGSSVRCEVDTNQLDAALRRLGEVGIRSLTSRPPTLEELFLRHYSDEQPATAIGGTRR
jgi:ABC-2 type transport system ATP-binding protein